MFLRLSASPPSTPKGQIDHSCKENYIKNVTLWGGNVIKKKIKRLGSITFWRAMPHVIKEGRNPRDSPKGTALKGIAEKRERSQVKFHRQG